MGCRSGFWGGRGGEVVDGGAEWGGGEGGGKGKMVKGCKLYSDFVNFVKDSG